jgi:hypothetical protein
MNRRAFIPAKKALVRLFKVASCRLSCNHTEETAMSLCLRVVKLALAVVVGVLAVVTGAQAETSWTDHSDIWWNQSESGWGMNMIQTASFIFATLYVYGPDGKPTWYTGQLQYASGTDNYSGPLYATTGPYFGGPFNPDNVKVRQAGTMSFTSLTAWTGTLSYTVDGTRVDKAIERQRLALDDYSGVYDTQSTIVSSNCRDTSYNKVYTAPGQATITQRDATMSVKLFGSLGEDTCDIPTTTYTQQGRMGRLEGPYSCPWGETGTAVLFEMNPSFYGFSARMTFDSPNFGCRTEGEIVGVIPR